MNFEYVIFPNLTLEQGLQLLVVAANTEQGRYLGDIRLLGRLPPAPQDRPARTSSVTLMVPTYSQHQKAQYSMLHALQSFAEQQGLAVKVGSFTGKRKEDNQETSPEIPNSVENSPDEDLREDDEQSSDSVDISWLIMAALLNRQIDPNQQTEKFFTRQLLAIGQVKSAAQVAEYFQVLAFHATNVRVAIAERPNMADLALFHVKDDRPRHSTVSSVRVTDIFPELFWMVEHSTLFGSIFLPEGSFAPEEILSLVAQFVCTAPAYFKSEQSQNPTTPLLLALLPNETPVGNKQVLYLRNLRFSEQYQIAEPASDYSRVEVVSLVNSSQLDAGALRQAIQEAYPPVGYRLHLKETRLRLYPYDQDPEQADQEEERLVYSIQDLQYQLAFLRSTRVHKPVLLRFTHRQLPAMADFFRQMAPNLLNPPQSYDSLENLPLRYAFQAHSGFPHGYHYLLVNANAATPLDYAHLTQWSALEDAADMRYWLDPSWATYDSAAGNRCFVFVPYGKTLFPALHSWDVSDLDSYLRGMFTEWLHDSNNFNMEGKIVLPMVPIYLFESIYGNDRNAEEGKEISLSILDQAEFGPLSAKLPWLNDNLVLHAEMCSSGFWERVYEYVSESADVKIRKTLLQQKTAVSHQVMDKFNQESSFVKDVVKKSIQELETVISNQVIQKTGMILSQLERITQQATEKTRDAQSLNLKLSQLRSDYDELLSLLNDVERRQGDVRNQANNIQSNAVQLDAAVDKAVVDTDTTVEKMDRMVSDKLIALEVAENRQRRRLASIQFRLW